MQGPPGKLADSRLSEQHRAGIWFVAYRYKSAFFYDSDRPFPLTKEIGVIRLVYLPNPFPDGAGVEASTNLTTLKSDNVFAPSVAAAQKFLPELTIETLRKARRTSIFHTPIPTRLGERDCWVVGDRVLVRGPRWIYTLEIYWDDPAQAAEPQRVLILTKLGTTKKWVWNQPFIFYHEEKLYRTQYQIKNLKLTSISFREYIPTIEEIVAFEPPLSNVSPAATVAEYLNGFLITWKAKELPTRLKSSSSEEFQHLIIAIEKGILYLDLASKRKKDVAQAQIEAGQTPNTDLIHLYDQRMAILNAILVSVKHELVDRTR